MSNNPLLKSFNDFDESVPFPEIKTEHFIPALKATIDEARKNVEHIKNDDEFPTFHNVVEALEMASDSMGPVLSTFFNLLHSNATPELQELAQEISSIHAAFASEVSLSHELFVKVKEVHDDPPANLSVEEKRLLDRTYKGFTRNGAILDDVQKEELREIDQELSKLSPQFSENVIKAQAAYKMHVEDKSQLGGLPETLLESAAHHAEENDKKGWLFTLDMPSYRPFVTYCNDRKLRETMWHAYSSRCFNGEFDNQEIINKIVDLRHKRARVLGYKHHAHYVLEERMAETPEQVEKFIGDLITISRPAAENELDELRAMMKKDIGDDDIKPWDVMFYMEKLKHERFDFNDEDLRPYFRLDKAVQGAFDLATRLYDITFEKVDNVPLYHEDVEVYKVTDTSTKKYMGLFYTDFFPRPTKKTGAWMTEFREQGLHNGEVKRPHVSIVCNFTKPTKTKPSLLTFDEVRTLFHEFGHGLHGLLSDCKYASLGGPNVFWDFVELPSQFMENWLYERDVIDGFAAHYETGDKIPDDLFQRVKSSSQFMAGYMSMRQLNFALLDMAWHGHDPGTVNDFIEFEKKVTARTLLLPLQPNASMSCSFSHIFGGGYSAGYYSYKWAEVLDADAFEHFKENGFKKEVAQSFRDNILSRGGTEHPIELYRRFRGKDPDPNALLRRDGLI